jgi:hypothetical protein
VGEASRIPQWVVRHGRSRARATARERRKGRPACDLLVRLRLALLYLAGWLFYLLALPPRPPEWLVAATGLPLLVLGSRAAYRGHAGSWRDFVRRTWDVHAVGVILLVALAVQCADTHGVTTDGVIYLSQLRSAIFDGDLDVAAEFAYLHQPPRPSHVVPIGPTFVWLPLYGVVAAFDTMWQLLGWSPAPADRISRGLTLPYVRAALLSSFWIAAAGLFVIHARLRREFAPAVALCATAMLFAATPLVWYVVYEPSMTHAASFGFAAIFVVTAASLTSVAMSVPSSVLLGALLGLAFITRPQEALLAIFPASLLMLSQEPFERRWRAALRLAAFAFLGVAPFLAAQAIHSWLLLSREPFALVGGGGYLDFQSSHWADTLWSSWHGLLSWTPVAYIACVATIFYLRHHPGWAAGTLLIVFLMAWVNGSTADWSGGWSFGGRRFIGVLPLLAPGIALAVSALARRATVAVALLAVGAISWNYLLHQQRERAARDGTAARSFAQLIQRQAALATEPPFIYPFAIPANVLFAWRTGLPIERYDLLGSESLRRELALDMDAAADRYLVTGWGSRVVDPFGTLRWIDGDRAELLLPLDPPIGGEVTIAWTARTRRLEPPELATFALVINGRETFRFTPDTDQSSHFAFTIPAGEQLLVRGFNRITFERRSGTSPIAVYHIAVR